MVRIEFWRSKPRRPFVRFQSKHVYRNVFNPFCFAIEFLETAGPAALESLFCRIHGDRGSGRERIHIRSHSESINGEPESLVVAWLVFRV